MVLIRTSTETWSAEYEMKNRREKGKDALEKDLEGRGAVSTGKHENSAQHAGDDPG